MKFHNKTFVETMLKQMKHCAKAFEDEANAETNPFIKEVFEQASFNILDLHYVLSDVKKMPEPKDTCDTGERESPSYQWERFWNE